MSVPEIIAFWKGIKELWRAFDEHNPEYQEMLLEVLRRCQEEGQTGALWSALEAEADDKRMAGGDWNCQTIIHWLEAQLGWRSNYRYDPRLHGTFTCAP